MNDMASNHIHTHSHTHIYGPANQTERREEKIKTQITNGIYLISIFAAKLYENRVPLQFAQRRVQIYA